MYDKRYETRKKNIRSGATVRLDVKLPGDILCSNKYQAAEAASSKVNVEKEMKTEGREKQN